MSASEEGDIEDVSDNQIRSRPMMFFVHLLEKVENELKKLIEDYQKIKLNNVPTI